MANSRVYDAIVVGVGAMGSAALYQLAKRGKRVLGIERFDSPNNMSSHFGYTRLIRRTHSEDPAMAPLSTRAYELWRDLELESERVNQLLHCNGVVDWGLPGNSLVVGSQTACRVNNFDFEVLDGQSLSRRFPGFGLHPEMIGVYQPEGGFLLPEKCIEAFGLQAQRRGAELHTHECVLDWDTTPDGGVRVRTDTSAYEAGSLVITAGPWASTLLPSLKGQCLAQRQVLSWFQTERPAIYNPQRFPVFNLAIDSGPLQGHYYGFPEVGVPGFKIGRMNHLGGSVDPDSVNRETDSRDVELLRETTAKYFPKAAGKTLSTYVCLWTNTPAAMSPDFETSWRALFIIDTLPEAPQVSFFAGDVGKGFKFSSVVGEILADLSSEGETSHEIAIFRSLSGATG